MVRKIESEKNNVEIGSIVDSQFDKLLSDDFRAATKIVIVDENTQEHCWPYLLTTFESLKEAEVIVLPSGEQNKSMEVCLQVWQALSEYKVRRGDLIINVGGEVVTDMGGFIASIYKRGISFINIPTTLLSMVDASVGGKTGVNLSPWKNQLGTFTLPKITICDPVFLQTLPADELRSGRAEMIKHGLISDASFYSEIISTQDFTTLDYITKAIQLKAEVVDKDPNEKGERKKLNFGHTVGHAIEGYCTKLGKPVTHGDCVAWGMIIEADLSRDIAGLDKSIMKSLSKEIAAIYGKAPIEEIDIDRLIELMKQDKKNTSNRLNCTLLKAISDSIIDGDVSEKQMYEAMLRYVKEEQ